MVMELHRYNFSRSDVDAKGAAYQEIVGSNLRGDRGQYFTPRRAVDLVVRILDPKPHEKVADIACGTGGFLVSTLAHQLRRFRAENKGEPGIGRRRAFWIGWPILPGTISSAQISIRSSSSLPR